MEEILGLGIAAILGIVVISIIVAGIFMLIGAKIAGVKNATLGKSIWAAIASGFIMWIVTLVFSIIPILGSIIGFIIGLILALLVIKSVYSTSFGKALLVWIFNIIAQVIAIFIGALLFAGGVASLL